MKICSICQTNFEGDFCPKCGQSVPTTTTKKSTKISFQRGIEISAIIRLLLLSVCNVGAVVVLFYALFRASKLSVWAQIVDSVASCALIISVGVWLWGLVKWTVFAIPKTFRVAKSIFSSIIPLNLFTLFIEFAVCASITLIPFSLYVATYSPILYAASFIDDYPNDIILPLLLLAVFSLASYLLGKRDFFKIFEIKKVTE